MFSSFSKKIFYHFHMPHKGSTVLKMEHLLHDERFWALLVGIALITGFVVLVILMSLYGESSPDSTTEMPTYFYHF